MGFYLRKSIRLGPIRLNLSKSGVGFSAGVKGLRYGVRPDGRAYVHAGRYGVYFRQELGGRRQRTTARGGKRPSPERRPDPVAGPTEVYETVAAAMLPRASDSDPVELLKDSYHRFRLDYLTAVVGLALVAASYAVSVLLGSLVAICGVGATLCVARWETQRRTVFLTYALEGGAARVFEHLVSAFNSLSSCYRIWAMISSTRLGDLHESKRHAGASSLVDRATACLGSGLPPWVEATIPFPAIQARGQTLYFLPNGILIYDASGIGFVKYTETAMSVGSVRFIEKNPASDAKIVDHTWLHPNKDGTPDQRFATNYRMPVCLYGEATISVGSRPLLYIQTSRDEAARPIDAALDNARRALLSPSTHYPEDHLQSAAQPWVEVNRERFQSGAAAIASMLRGLSRSFRAMIGWVDRRLSGVADEGNRIIHWLLRCLSLAVAGIVLVVLVYAATRIPWR